MTKTKITMPDGSTRDDAFATMPRFLYARMWAELTRTQIIVLIDIVSYRNHQTGLAYPKMGTIAHDIGMSMPTVKRAIRKLKALGWITARRRPEGGRANVYTVPAMDAWDGASPSKARGHQHDPMTTRATGHQYDPTQGITHGHATDHQHDPSNGSPTVTQRVTNMIPPSEPTEPTNEPKEEPMRVRVRRMAADTDRMIG